MYSVGFLNFYLYISDVVWCLETVTQPLADCFIVYDVWFDLICSFVAVQERRDITSKIQYRPRTVCGVVRKFTNLTSLGDVGV